MRKLPMFTESARALSGCDDMTCRAVDRIRVMGRSRAVDLFTFWNPDIPPEDRAIYGQAVDAYRGGNFSEALEAFGHLKEKYPSDSLSSLYAERCREQLASPSPERWDGISQAKSK